MTMEYTEVIAATLRRHTLAAEDAEGVTQFEVDQRMC